MGEDAAKRNTTSRADLSALASENKDVLTISTLICAGDVTRILPDAIARKSTAIIQPPANRATHHA